MFVSFMKRSFLSKALPCVSGLCLVVGALLFTGCNTDSGNDDAFVDRQFVPLGTWVSKYEGGEDSYTIEAGTLTYISSYSGTWKGTIEAAVDFSPTSGVLIVKYTTAPTGEYAGHTDGKNYTGVYYTEYSADSTDFADAWLPDDPYPTERAEASSLNEALKLFTAGNEGTHVGDYGTYLK
ncbi:MAG: hypothetical protein LBC51_10265 [Treponema sp.]|nr:hypothetical protein [Treponema sp.]